jgi:hypothetical protein
LQGVEFFCKILLSRLYFAYRMTLYILGILVFSLPMVRNKKQNNLAQAVDGMILL